MKGIFILSILVGISYVFAAIITKKNPTFIAGYSKFDEAQQKTFPNFLNKILIITGIITFVGCSIFTLLEWNIMAVIFLIMPSVIMIFIALIREKKTESKKATKIRILFFLLFILIIPAFIIISSKEPSVLFESDNIKITGLYGESIPVKDIAEVTMLKHIPPIQLRTNGFALGTVYKGYFLIGETETVKLFLNSASAPCIKIKTVENKIIIINFRSEDKTTAIYTKIKNRHEKCASISEHSGISANRRRMFSIKSKILFVSGGFCVMRRFRDFFWIASLRSQ